jgi:hypothetical protein
LWFANLFQQWFLLVLQRQKAAAIFKGGGNMSRNAELLDQSPPADQAAEIAVLAVAIVHPP